MQQETQERSKDILKEATKQTESKNASRTTRQRIRIKNKFAHDHGVNELGSNHP